MMRHWDLWWFNTENFFVRTVVWMSRFILAFFFVVVVPGYGPWLAPLFLLFVLVLFVKIFTSLFRRTHHAKISVLGVGAAGGDVYRVSSEGKIQIKIEQRRRPPETVMIEAPLLRGFCQESDFSRWSEIYSIEHSGDRDKRTSLIQGVPREDARALVKWLATETNTVVLRGQE
jgi:hypothetical protein